MKKFYLSLAVLTLTFTCLFTGQTAKLQSLSEPQTDAVSTTLVLSQVYGGGGGSTGTYLYDYVEIKNISNVSQSLSGLSLVYGSATGNFSNSFGLPAVSLFPGQYYLVQLSNAGTSGSMLPVPPDAASTNISMGGAGGKIGLATASFPLSTCGATATPCSAAQLSQLVDWVAYGTGGNGAAGNGEGGTSVNNGTAMTSVQGGIRKGSGCTDTDNNNLDFDVVTNPVPRNSSSPRVICLSNGLLQGSGGADPSSVAPGETSLLGVLVSPAASPPSTGITVIADLTSIGGAASQTFYDDGTHGDAIPGDNQFSYLITVPLNAGSGMRNFPVNIADAQMRTATTTIALTVTGAPQPSDHLLLGNPSNATANTGNPLNYLMPKPQYVISYNRDRGTPNWVAWHLDSTWLGSAPRQDDFRPDPALPANWYHVTDADYSGSGFDRGHHCPSGDRTDTIPDNSATFLMTNMMPQAGNNNQGPWADLETYCRDLVTQGYELYIYAGGTGIGGTGTNGGVTNTIANGHVTVPSKTWKVVLILPAGLNDLDRITKSTRTIAVIMPNQQSIGINTPWRNFRTNVKDVEALTGYNFFSNVRPIVRRILKLRKDTQ
jgi:DNA/RNA endonuclease G (NUC1)